MGDDHWKRPWCWKRLKAEREGDNRGWDDWMASLTQWTWVWVNSWSWWWTGRPGVLRFMGSQRVGHDWAIELITTSPEEGDGCSDIWFKVGIWFSRLASSGPMIGTAVPSITQLCSVPDSKGSTRERKFIHFLGHYWKEKILSRNPGQTPAGMSLARSRSHSHL